MTDTSMVYQFGQHVLDTAQFQLSGADGPIAVEPQVFDLLVYLIDNRQRLVTRDELFDNLWRGKVVTESALGARLKDVRKAVGDSGRRQRVIKTIHGRGYQFVETVIEADSPVKPRVPETRFAKNDGVGIAFLAVGLVFINLAVDLTYAFLDPRIHYE